MAKKKITRVGGVSPTPDSVTKKFVPTADSKGKATQLSVIAALLWLFAVGAQVVVLPASKYVPFSANKDDPKSANKDA